MKVQVDVADLQRIVKQAGLSISKTSVNPMFQAVLLQTKKDMLKAVGTSIEVSTTGTVRADVGVQGATVVPYAKLAATVDKLSPGKVVLEVKGTALEVKTRRGRYKFQASDPTDYPEVPSVPKGSRFQLPREELVRAFKGVSMSLADDSSHRMQLKAIRAQWTAQGFRAVASNGIRISAATDPLVIAEGLEQDVLIPGSGARALTGILGALPDERVNVGFSDRLFAFVPGASCSILLGKSDGPMIDFDPFLLAPPNEFGVDRVELLQCLRRLAVFGSDVVCSLTPERASFSVGDNDASEELACEGVGELKVKIGSEPFIEGLAAMRSERVRFAGNALEFCSVRDGSMIHGAMPIARVK